MTTEQFCISVLISLIEFALTVAAIVVAVFSGDVAAYRLQTRREDRHAEKARLNRLRMLQQQAIRAKSVVDSHLAQQITKNGRMPVAPFNGALLSDNPTFDDCNGLLTAITHYLNKAESVNLLVDTYMLAFAGKTGPQDVAQEIRLLHESTPNTLTLIENLHMSLRAELGEETRTQDD
jgi:hypothetical protein